MNTDKQAIINIQNKIEKLKSEYLIEVQKVLEKKDSNTLAKGDLINCMIVANKYFNCVENFVGESDILGAHNNGNWLTNFAETCHEILNVYLSHIVFVRSHSKLIGYDYTEPSKFTLASTQRVVSKFLPVEVYSELKAKLKKENISTSGFDQPALKNKSEVFSILKVVGIIVGALGIISIITLAIYFPEPTHWQQLIFRATFSISVSLISSPLAGKFILKGKSQDSIFGQFNLYATGAIAIFVFLMIYNPEKL